jgi:hypothetical protein
MTHPIGGTPMQMPMPMDHAGHHAMATATHTPATTGTAPAAPVLGLTPGTLLTALFATAAITFLILLLRNRTPTHHRGSKRPSTRTEHALEALGATTMALMFATTT